MDTQYNIIREQGEFMDPIELSEDDNEKVVKATEEKEKTNE